MVGVGGVWCGGGSLTLFTLSLLLSLRGITHTEGVRWTQASSLFCVIAEIGEAIQD